MHSGGAYSGHYYAYIKSFDDNKWYVFNDSKIDEVNVEELPSLVFGGTGKSGYMLLYKLYDPAK